MYLRKRHSFAAVLTAIALVGCVRKPSSDSGAAGKGVKSLSSWHLPPCQLVEVSTSGWQAASSGDGTITLKIPSDSRPLIGTDGTWVLQEGSFSFRYAPLTPLEEHRDDSIATDPTSAAHGWCQDQLDGVTTLLQYVYSPHAATGPGYYLQAHRPVDERRELMLLGYARDTSHAPILLAIARSLKILVNASGR